MIVNIEKLQEAIIQTLREVNDACLQMRQEGITVLLPDSIEFTANLVTGNDINAVPRLSTEAELDGGTVVTLREQLAPDISTIRKTGESFRTLSERGPTTERTTITHPSVQTQAGGVDRGNERVEFTYTD